MASPPIDRSAVMLGYLSDSYIQNFVKRPTRKPPVINRGTFLRNHAINALVDAFLLENPKPSQIVSIGAGFDTRYFNLNSESRQPTRYYEIDFEQVTMGKAMRIKKSKELSLIVGESAKVLKGGADFASTNYFLLGGDLRDWSTVVGKLKSYGFDSSLPTLWLSECVLVYMESVSGDAILKWIAEETANATVIIYEQCNILDSFGSVMLENLSTRGIGLPSLREYPTLESQRQRFVRLGFTPDLKDMLLWYNELPDKVKKNLDLIERLDELEEWRLLLQHYFLGSARSNKAIA